MNMDPLIARINEALERVRAKMTERGVQLSEEFCAVVKLKIFEEFRHDRDIRRILAEGRDETDGYIDWERCVELEIEALKPLRVWLPRRE